MKNKVSCLYSLLTDVLYVQASQTSHTEKTRFYNVIRVFYSLKQHNLRKTPGTMMLSLPLSDYYRKWIKWIMSWIKWKSKNKKEVEYERWMFHFSTLLLCSQAAPRIDELINKHEQLRYALQAEGSLSQSMVGSETSNGIFSLSATERRQKLYVC